MPTLTDPDADKKYAPKTIPSTHNDGLEDKFAAPDSDQIANLERSFAAPAATDSGSQKIADKQKLSSQETEPDNPMNFTGGQKNGKQKRRWWNRKRAGIAGSIVGVGLGGSLLLGTISVGPLELITVSHALQNSFSRSNEESSSRLGDLFRFSRYHKTGNFGETRLTALGSKVFGGAISQLSDAGVEFKTLPNGSLAEMTVEQDKLSKSVPDLQNEPLGSDGAKSILARQLGVDASTITYESGGKFSIDLRGQSIKSLRLLQKNSLHLVNGKIVASIKARYLKKAFDLPSLLHPFSKARAALERKYFLAAEEKNKANGESDSQAAAAAEAEAMAQEENEAYSKSVTEPTATDAKERTKAIQDAGAGVGGALVKGLTYTGAACIIRNTAGDIAKANRDIVALPAAAAAMRVVAAGEQAESGEGGVTAEQVGAMVQSFNNKQNQSVLEGAAMQSLQNPGTPSTGSDLPNNYRAAFSDKSTAQTIKEGADNIINAAVGGGFIPGLTASTVCSKAGLLVQVTAAIAATVGSEILTGGLNTPGVAALWTAKFAASNVISIVAFGAVIDIIKNVAIDSQLPQNVFSGPVGGDLLAYGSRVASNVASVASGGVSLNNTTGTLQDTTASQYAYSTNQSESTFARLFSLKNYDSLASHLALSYNTKISSGLPNLANAFLNISSDLSSTFSSLMPRSFAAATNNYDWDFPQYGIPDDILNDPSLANPYANADTVAALLDGDNSSNYITKARACFGVEIAKNSDGQWDVIPGDAVDTSSTEYTSAGCDKDSTSGGVSNSDWHRLIMFVFDTSTMKATACYDGDESSCNDLSASNTNTSSTATSGNMVSGDATTLAGQVLANPNIVLESSARADVEAASKGQTVTPGPIGGTSGGSDANTTGCTARTPVYLDATLLQAMLNIASKYKYQINNITSGHACDSGRHPLGRAMDIFAVNGKQIEGHCTDPDIYGFLKYTTTMMAQLLPNGRFISSRPVNMAGIGSCNPAEDGNIPSWVPGNINYFYDWHDEIHVDTGVAS